MKWATLHHPDLSLPVIRRRIGEEILFLLAGTADLVLSRGLSTLYAGCYPNRHTYMACVSRLKKRGLITTSSKRGEMPAIRLSPDATALLPPYLAPQKYWRQRWNNRWYLLMFDVPEASRSYRDTLRAFLKTRRFGCLQKSVWVTPNDVRAEYDDLNRAAAVDSVAFLFESQTVLGFGAQSVVQEAWNFKKINELQKQYIRTTEENLNRIPTHAVTEESILQLLRLDNQAYSQVMKDDPLLPRALHPADYVGPEAKAIHDQLIQHAIASIHQ